MGVGIDVSLQYKLQRSLGKLEKVKQKAVEELLLDEIKYIIDKSGVNTSDLESLLEEVQG